MMKAKALYKRLDTDFELDSCKDNWSHMDFNEYISDNFKKRYMGLLVDNIKEIDSIYTAVFPSDLVLNKILEDKKENVLLVTHHPMIWDVRKTPVFQDINLNLLPKLKHQKISIYTMHVPLDKNGEYSTTTNLAKALDIIPEGEFYEYFGVKVGIYGKTNLHTPEELADKLISKVNHKTKLWKYGTDEIQDQRVALVAGGGNEIDIIQEIIDLGINTYVTGISAINEYSQKTHEFEKENGINLIGGTHYSTEKFACIALYKYFEKLGLDCEFIEDHPVMEDME
ncbi:MAG: Nif3-like dinuclear metal center hexameric protein [Promethearchaeota archaeon]|nr:MAG: Nif3-like dinuclear metal center hexameric protein [Candidatus Lokiarchaeota archaeon]